MYQGHAGDHLTYEAGSRSDNGGEYSLLLPIDAGEKDDIEQEEIKGGKVGTVPCPPVQEEKWNEADRVLQEGHQGLKEEPRPLLKAAGKRGLLCHILHEDFFVLQHVGYGPLNALLQGQKAVDAEFLLKGCISGNDSEISSSAAALLYNPVIGSFLCFLLSAFNAGILSLTASNEGSLYELGQFLLADRRP